MPDLKFGGVYLPCNVEAPSSLSRPKRKLQAFSVPGRSGDIILMEDAYENYAQDYNINFSDDVLSVAENADDLAKKLFLDGYQKLEDSFEPGVFRWAYFEGPFDIENLMKIAGRAKIRFICKPQRFLTSGETVVTKNASGTITNPTQCASKPLLRIYGTGTFTINGVAITVASHGQSYVDVDCEMMDCYNGATSLNEYVSFSGNDFPVLSPGSNSFTFGTGITQVRITPRWWKL